MASDERLEVSYHAIGGCLDAVRTCLLAPGTADLVVDDRRHDGCQEVMDAVRPLLFGEGCGRGAVGLDCWKDQGVKVLPGRVRCADPDTDLLPEVGEDQEVLVLGTDTYCGHAGDPDCPVGAEPAEVLLRPVGQCLHLGFRQEADVDQELCEIGCHDVLFSSLTEAMPMSGQPKKLYN